MDIEITPDSNDYNIDEILNKIRLIDKFREIKLDEIERKQRKRQRLKGIKNMKNDDDGGGEDDSDYEGGQD